MKTKTKIAMLCMLVAVSACGKVPAGHKGVKVKLYGTSKGVNAQEMGVGRYWLGFNTELYTFPTFTQNYEWVSPSRDYGDILFQTEEGMEVSADIGISYRIKEDKVVEVFQKYRKGVDEITNLYLKNMVRDAFVTASSSKPIESIYGEGKVALIKEVQASVVEQVVEIGIEIEKIYYVGNMYLPKSVTNALNAKIEATQRAQQRENEVAEATAEANKKIAEAKGVAESTLIEARAKSEANKLKAQSYTASLLKAMWIDKWDGTTPTMVTGSDTGLMLNTGK